MSIRRITVTGLTTLAALTGGLTLTPALSLASHIYENAPSSHFGEAGSGDGQFSDPTGVAVDEATGDVYVVDSGNSRVEKFDAEGNYVSQFGGETPAESLSNPYSIAVDNSTDPAKGDVYVTDVGHGVIDVFDSTGKYLSQMTGTPAGAFAELEGVAVDASGNVWVYEGYGNVDEFGDTGSFVMSFNTGRGSTPAFTVGPSGQFVYVVFGEPAVGIYETATGRQVGTEFSQNVSALAVSPHNLFVDTGSRIEQYGLLGGESVALFGEGGAGLKDSHGVAVNGTNGVVYASKENADTIDVFKATFLRPTVSALPASSLTPAGAVLYGTVDTQDSFTEYHFVYGTTSDYGMRVPAHELELASFAGGARAVSQSIEGLRPATTYHFAIVATNTGGTSQSADMTFTTPSLTPPTVLTGTANAISQNAAQISGTVDPRGVQSTYEFDLGTDTSYGTRVFGDAGSRSEPQTITLPLQGLAPGTTYHYRILASNTYGTTYGADDTFTTPGVPSSLLTAPAASVLVPTPVFPTSSATSIKTSSKMTRPKKKKKKKKKKKNRSKRSSTAGHGHGKGRNK